MTETCGHMVSREIISMNLRFYSRLTSSLPVLFTMESDWCKWIIYWYKSLLRQNGIMTRADDLKKKNFFIFKLLFWDYKNFFDAVSDGKFLAKPAR